MDVKDDAVMTGAHLRSLRRLVRPHRRQVLVVTVLSIAAACVPIGTAAINRAVVERFVRGDVVAVLVVCWIGCVVLEGLSSGSAAWMAFRVGRGVAAKLEVRVFERLAAQSLRYHERVGVTEAHTVLTYSTARVAAVLTESVAWGIASAVQAIGAMLGMTLVLPRLAPIAAGMIGVVLIVPWWLIRRANSAQRLIDIDKQRIELTDEVFEDRRLRLIKRDPSLQRRLVSQFATVTRDREAVMRRRQMAAATSSQMTLMLPVLAVPLAWSVAGAGVRLGSIVAFATLMSFALSSSTRFVAIALKVVETWPELDRAVRVLEAPLDAASEHDATIRPETIAGQPLALRGLHCHRGGVHVLKGIELVAEPGDRIALVGPNGAGKTTLLDIVTGLVPPEGDGWSARIGDVPIAHIPAAVLKVVVMAVDAMPVTFAGSARDNIARHHPEATEVEIRQACDAAEIAYPLDREAARLSAGEQVQLLVAVALLAWRSESPPSIVLVDESFKHLHPRTRGKLRAHLRRLLPEAIMIEVVHEGAVTASAFTRVVVMADGRIVEQVTHAELLERGGHYTVAVDASD